MSMKQAEDLAEQISEMIGWCRPQGLIRDDLVNMIAKWLHAEDVGAKISKMIDQGAPPTLISDEMYKWRQAADLGNKVLEMIDQSSPRGLVKDHLVDLIDKWERPIELVHSRCGTFERGKVPPLRPRGRRLRTAP